MISHKSRLYEPALDLTLPSNRSVVATLIEGGNLMENLNRRHALVLGAALLPPLAFASQTAQAAMYPADAGKAIYAGGKTSDAGTKR
jgi:hypothetical protein